MDGKAYEPFYRIGFGYDLHVFDLIHKKPLILGGVHISDHHGVQAHSDGDVVTHAIIDALLGAACLGDIGHFFPDTDPKWKNHSSLKMLQAVHGKLQALNYVIQNIDLTIITEKPKISIYRIQIQQSIADCLLIDNNQVSIKSTTNEKMDAIGSKKAIAVHAVCLLKSKAE